MVNCWICGNQANSGEHKIKRTDLKHHITGASQNSPIYHRSNGQLKRPIRSLKADAFKYKKSICDHCNGTLTQKYDLAWEGLSEYLHTTKLDRNATVNLDSVFPGDVYDNIKSVHLFFAKQFGCKVIESELDLDTSDLATSIKSDKLCSSLYIKIRHSDNGKYKDYCSISDIEVSKDKNGNVLYSHFFYTVGKYTVDILYTDEPSVLDLTGYFQPSESLDKFEICEVNYPQGYEP